MRHRPRCKKYGSTKKKEKSPKHKLKSKIMACYAEGMGINSLCRVFKVGINSLQRWIKEEGEKFIQPDIEEEKFVSCDEMWTYVQKKKQKGWIWLCYSKMTKKILAVHIGDRGQESAKRLIEQVPNMKIYCTDDWDAYGCAIENPETREIEKRNTQDIERFNLRMRMVLARLQRKTIKFSKSWERLEYSVNFVVNRYNHQLILDA